MGQEPGIVVTRLAVTDIPRSGKPQELLDMFGISAKNIAAAVRQTFANWGYFIHSGSPANDPSIILIPLIATLPPSDRKPVVY